MGCKKLKKKTFRQINKKITDATMREDYCQYF